jgi:rod shape-determining protein MreD
MKMNKAFFRYLAYALEIVIFYVLQDTPKLVPEVLGSKPLLLVCIALSIAAWEKPVPSLIFGAVCGGLIDIASGSFGCFAIALTLVCYAEAEIFRKYFVSSILSIMAFSLVAVGVVICVYFVIFKLFADFENAGALFVNHYISRIAYTTAAVIPFYFLNKFLYINS